MKIAKKTLISLLSIGGIGLTGAGIGIGYAIHQPQTINHNIEPPQPFWIYLTGFQNGKNYTINKNDISNTTLQDEHTVVFNYAVGEKKLKYDINSRYDGTRESKLWVNPFQIFLNKDNTATSFNFKDYFSGGVLIEITEI